MQIQADTVYSQIFAEGPEFIWLQQRLTFQREDEEPICLITPEGYIYTGLLMYLKPELEQFGVSIDLSNVLVPISVREALQIPETYLKGITLRDYQIKVAAKAIAKTRGVIELPTGAGKSEIAIIILKWLYEHGYIRKALIIAPTEFLVQQFYERMMKRLHGLDLGDPRIPTEAVSPKLGMLGGGCRHLSADFLVTTPDSFFGGLKMQNREIMEWAEQTDLLLGDECIAAGSMISMGDGTTKPLDTVQVGDMVATPLGPKKVLAATYKGIREVVQIETDRGHVLCCTPDHPIASLKAFPFNDAPPKDDFYFQCSFDWREAAQLATKPDSYGWQVGYLKSDRIFPMSDSLDRFRHGILEAFCENCNTFANVVSVDRSRTHNRAYEKMVYDLDVEEAHCFFAEGILVHNCHHLAAYSWSMIANHLHRAKFRYGLTPCLWDDPFEPAVEDFTVVGMLGPVVAKIPTSYLAEKGYLASTHVSVVHVHYPVVRGGMWHQIYNDGIAKHRQRNGIILSLASQLYDAGRKVLVLVWRKAHGWRLIQALSHMGYPAEFVRGGGCADTFGPRGWATRNLTVDQLTREYTDKDRYLLVLSSVGDEGFNLPSINATIIASSMKKHRRTIQRIGRGMRAKSGENAVYIFDFVDAHNTSLHRQSMRRVGTYQYEGHPVYVGLDSARQKLGLPLDVSVIPKIPNYSGGPGKED